MADTKISALTGATTPLAGTEVLPIVQSGATKKVSIDNVTAGRTVPVAALNPNVDMSASFGPALNGMMFYHSVVGTTVRAKTATVFDWSIYSAAGNALLTNPTGTDNITVNTGNLVIGTAGKGIDFSADPSAAGMTSELLDDYEEGTWTATLYDAGTGGNASAITKTGYYTKIGDVVHCFINSWNNISTAGMTAGNGLYISLPFVQSASVVSAGTVVLDSVSLPAGRTSADLYGNGLVDRVSLIASGSAVGIADILVSDFSSGVSDITRLEFTYKV